MPDYECKIYTFSYSGVQTPALLPKYEWQIQHCRFHRSDIQVTEAPENAYGCSIPSNCKTHLVKDPACYSQKWTSKMYFAMSSKIISNIFFKIKAYKMSISI